MVETRLLVVPDIFEVPLVVEAGLLVKPDVVAPSLVAVQFWMYGLVEMVPLTE